MTGGDWILCECAPRWASALRLAISRGEAPVPPRRFYESRTLADTLAQLSAWPQSLVLVEVNRANFAALLDWLAATTPQYPSARIVALLDADLTGLAAPDVAASVSDSREIRNILVEAGASVVIFSPRRLRDLFSLAERHATQVAQPTTPSANQPLEEWAWSLLPWQDA